MAKANLELKDLNAQLQKAMNEMQTKIVKTNNRLSLIKAQADVNFI